MKTTTLPSKHSMNRSHCPLGLLIISFALASLALSPRARAVCQDACLANNNTVQGDNALHNLTTGSGNTATGFQALYSNRSEEHTSELQSHSFISYAVFCLK